MRVEILSLDRSEAILVTPGTLGYRGRFRCERTEGTANLVPYSEREDALAAGARLSVETSQESVSQFQIVSTRRAPGIWERARPGDYTVVGTVSAVVVGAEVIDIDACGLSFAVSYEESAGVVPREGERVAFRLHGLSLWCSNVG